MKTTIKLFGTAAVLMAFAACNTTNLKPSGTQATLNFPFITAAATPAVVTSDDTKVMLSVSLENPQTYVKAEFYRIPRGTNTTPVLVDTVTGYPFFTVIKLSEKERQDSKMSGDYQYVVKVYDRSGNFVSQTIGYRADYCFPSGPIFMVLPQITASSSTSKLVAPGKVTLAASTQSAFNVEFYRVQGTKETLIYTDCIKPFGLDFAFSKAAQNGTYKYKLKAVGAGDVTANLSFDVAIP